MLVAKYIIRYITSNKSYLINPAIMFAFVSYIVFRMNESGFSDGIVIGLAVITFNPPLAIIVSSSKGLYKKLNSIPNKIKCFYIPYGVVIFTVNIIFSTLLIIVTSLIGSHINVKTIIAALIFPIQNAIGTVFLEYTCIFFKLSDTETIQKRLCTNLSKTFMPRKPLYSERQVW